MDPRGAKAMVGEIVGSVVHIQAGVQSVLANDFTNLCKSLYKFCGLQKYHFYLVTSLTK